MLLTTLLVGTDSTPRSDPAILSGHRIAGASGARLVLCHVAPAQLGSHPLFPQLYEAEALSALDWDQRIGDAISSRVVELTGRTPDDFHVVIDQGDVATVLSEQASRLRAELMVVMDQSENPRTVTRDLARSSPCSVLAIGASTGTRVAVSLLQEELALVPELIDAARTVLALFPSEIDIIVTTQQVSGTSAVHDEMARYGAELGLTLVPWFATVDDTSTIARAAADPSHGLVALAAPVPEKLTAASSSPLDDVLPVARCTLLLLRTTSA